MHFLVVSFSAVILGCHTMPLKETYLVTLCNRDVVNTPF